MESTNPFKSTKKQIIEEVPYGIYVWRLPSGEILGDGDNIMQVFCMKGEKTAIAAITDAARHYGFEEGTAVWWSGHRPVTDEEYEEQVMRERLGMVPDPLDFAALRDEARAKRKHND